MLADLPYAQFPVLNCGVDWLTCVSKRQGVSNELEDFGYQLLRKEEAAEGRISAAKRLGYVGLKSGHIFLGKRPADVMIQVSGQLCTPLAENLIRLSTSVSRIDLQVTIWTEGEQVNLSQWTRDRMAHRRLISGEHGALDLISNWPAGGTLMINRRVTEEHGRLYDKTVESNLGPPRLVWRYEVETKGTRARQLAMRLVRDGVHPHIVNTLVHAWYTKRGVQPAFEPTCYEYASQPIIETPSRDVLSWMRLSLSKTISKAIAKHGERTVLEALGLSHLLERGSVNGATRTVHPTMAYDISLPATRSDMPERILLLQPDRPERPRDIH